MKQTAWLLAAVCIALLAGCVSTQKYQAALADLESARQANEQTTTAFDTFKKEAQRTHEGLESTIAQLRREAEEQKQISAQLQDERSQVLLERNDLQRKVQELDDHAKDLTTRLAAEQTQVAKLRDDKQRLLAGTTTAQEEIERMQKRIGELEVEEARARDLEQRLDERGQELLSLTERLGVIEAQARDLERRVTQRDNELARLRQEMEQKVASLTNERDQLLAERDELTTERDRLAAERNSLTAERDTLTASLETKEDRLRAEAAEKARLERERQAKEEEIRRLTQTHDELKHSLEAEIAKGDIRIRQVRDKLTINMVDRVLFDSGRAFVKPAGLKVLKQMSDILKSVDDKQIRIEGHTDNVPIGVKLQDRFPTNWELSTARATSVVRYLIEKGEIAPDNISAVGYADTRPIASNDDETGRQVNRRIEIVLYPRDLKDIASEIGASVEN